MRDRKQGETLNIESTPSLFINGRRFPSSPDFDQDLKDWLDLEFELTGAAAKPPPPPSVSAPVASAPAAASAPPPPSPSSAPAGSARPVPSTKPSP
jgi:hypothetical protein